MAHDFLWLYHGSYDDAFRLHETELWEKSFRENVACARAIEKALRGEYAKTGPLPPDCAAKVLEEYGFKRVNYVLASTILDMKDLPLVSGMLGEESLAWARNSGTVPDAVYGHFCCVEAPDNLLTAFLRQTQEAYMVLGLFDRGHCSAGMYEENVEGRVLVMDPSTLKENCWTQEDQLWLAEGGFGCDPKSSGRAIYAVCLSDGEKTRWNREDFVGVLDEQYLPEWAKQALEAIQEPEQKPVETHGPGEMTMC